MQTIIIEKKNKKKTRIKARIRKNRQIIKKKNKQFF